MSEIYNWAAAQPVFIQVALGLALFVVGAAVVRVLFEVIGVLSDSQRRASEADSAKANLPPARPHMAWGIAFWIVVLVATIIVVTTGYGK